RLTFRTGRPRNGEMMTMPGTAVGALGPICSMAAVESGNKRILTRPCTFSQNIQLISPWPARWPVRSPRKGDPLALVRSAALGSDQDWGGRPPRWAAARCTPAAALLRPRLPGRGGRDVQAKGTSGQVPLGPRQRRSSSPVARLRRSPKWTAPLPASSRERKCGAGTPLADAVGATSGTPGDGSFGKASSGPGPTHRDTAGGRARWTPRYGAFGSGGRDRKCDRYGPRPLAGNSEGRGGARPSRRGPRPLAESGAGRGGARRSRRGRRRGLWLPRSGCCGRTDPRAAEPPRARPPGGPARPALSVGGVGAPDRTPSRGGRWEVRLTSRDASGPDSSSSKPRELGVPGARAGYPARGRHHLATLQNGQSPAERESPGARGAVAGLRGAVGGRRRGKAGHPGRRVPASAPRLPYVVTHSHHVGSTFPQIDSGSLESGVRVGGCGSPGTLDMALHFLVFLFVLLLSGTGVTGTLRSSPNPSLEIYKKMFEVKRREQLLALKNLAQLNDVHQQYEILDVMLKGLFKVLEDSRTVLIAADVPPEGPLPQDEKLKDAFSQVVENTAFFGDVVLRFPRIVHHYFDHNSNWNLLIRWGISFCNQSGVFDQGPHAPILSLMAQELGISEKDSDFQNPFKVDRTEVSRGAVIVSALLCWPGLGVGGGLQG
ncbi:Coiled-coil domain-containing protein 134, partial [Galemys pyrenaicus]